MAGPFFLISIGLNSWATLDFSIGLAGNSWAASRSRGQVRWHASRTVGRKSRPFVITGLLIVVLAIAVREQLPRRRASSLAVVLLALLGVALMLAAFRVDTAMLRGGNPSTWNCWVHGIAFLLIIAMGTLAPPDNGSGGAQ